MNIDWNTPLCIDRLTKGQERFYLCGKDRDKDNTYQVIATYNVKTNCFRILHADEIAPHLFVTNIIDFIKFAKNIYEKEKPHEQN